MASRRTADPRAGAAQVLAQVYGAGRSLATALPPVLARLPAARRPLVQELCYGTLRWGPRLEWLLERLLERPLKPRDGDLRALLLLGLYQLHSLDLPPHAAVAETVSAASALGKSWARGLVNGVLRRFQRERAELLAVLEREPAAALAHPPWLLVALQEAWANRWRAVAEANNQRPPMTLRVNRRQGTQAAYAGRLAAAGITARPAPHVGDGLILDQPLPVERLPGFTDGAVSVQDSAAQLAADLLAPASGQRILDACAAPGGKTAHLLERAPEAEVTALDRDPERLQRVAENLERLGLNARLLAADAGTPEVWWDGRPFDRILLDAPCSATGVIRRHPDIKILRRATDLPALAAEQRRLLAALWPLLASGGILVYATCSVLPLENHEVVTNFLANQPDAREEPIRADWGRPPGAGRQILPGEDGMDGFYYACLTRR